MTKFQPIMPLLAVVALGSCMTPEYKGCTLIGCVDGYTVAFNHSSWPAGSYQVDIDIDGQKFSCSTTLPFESCTTGGQVCNSDKVRLELSGCALPATSHSIAGLNTSLVDFNEMKLKITHDSATLLDRSLHPIFKTSQPNGPGCDPICHNASDIVQF